MVRKILCLKCGAEFNLYQEDISQGWKIRRIEGTVKKPKDHFIEIHTLGQQQKKINIPILRCDNCDIDIIDGSKAFAVTYWRGEIPPGYWESEYFTND